MASEILEGFIHALELIVSGDRAVLEITLRSLYISGTATLLAITWSLPLGILIGSRELHGKRVIKGFFNAMLGIPTVGLGLILYLLLSKSGPLGVLHLLYRPSAVIMGQAILVTPIVVSLAANAVEDVERHSSHGWG